MEQKEIYNQKIEISVFDVLNALFKKWYIVVITAALLVTTAYVYINFFCTPLYSSTAKIFIFNTDSSVQSSNEVSISTSLARDYTELITDATVLETVKENLDLKYSYTVLKNMVSINNPTGTRILEITVISTEGKLSKRIADEVCKVSQEKIVELMGIDRVNIISEGRVSANPSYPNKRLYILNAFLISLGVSVLIILILLIASDKIDSEDDIKRYLDLSVLAIIPYTNAATKKKTAILKRKKQHDF